MTIVDRPATPVRAWVRPPSDAFADCLRQPGVPAPDATVAMEEHAGYVDALRKAGVEVVVLDADPQLPDACFVEDGAVLMPGHAMLTRPGAQSRRAEVATLQAPLAKALRVDAMREPATLDGGDVMRLGDRLVIGRSSRTNDDGIEQLRVAARDQGLSVVVVDVRQGLHLKSACTVLDARTVVVDPGALVPEVLAQLGLEVHCVPEPVGANVLAFGDRVLVSSEAPATAHWLRSRGHTVVEVAIGQFHRGDGALSCLSLRQAPAGGWSV